MICRVRHLLFQKAHHSLLLTNLQFYLGQQSRSLIRTVTALFILLLFRFRRRSSSLLLLLFSLCLRIGRSLFRFLLCLRQSSSLFLLFFEVKIVIALVVLNL